LTLDSGWIHDTGLSLFRSACMSSGQQRRNGFGGGNPAVGNTGSDLVLSRLHNDKVGRTWILVDVMRSPDEVEIVISLSVQYGLSQRDEVERKKKHDG
jgi:hypothetical protein